MTTPALLYRNASRRLHRVIANYFAIRAWTAGADCIVLDRRVLEPMLDLERIKKVRVKWIAEDMKHWFPYVESINYTKTDSVGVIFLSRVPIEEHMGGVLTDEDRVNNLRK